MIKAIAIKYSKVEKEKFLDIITTNKNLIYKVCNLYCSNPLYRSDLEQEILIQLWNSFKKFDGRVKISTWIYKIALNTAISQYRKEKKRIDKPMNLDKYVISLPNIEYNPEIDEALAVLLKLIGQLSILDKALMMLYLDNYKHKDIAEILGISESNVATKIGRIKKSLKKQINNYKN